MYRIKLQLPRVVIQQGIKAALEVYSNTSGDYSRQIKFSADVSVMPSCPVPRCGSG